MNTGRLAFLVVAISGLAVACGSSSSGKGSGGAGGSSGAAAAGGAAAGAAGASGTSGASGSGGTAGTDAGNPACAAADSHGFFTSCTTCTDPGNCDTIDVGGSSRHACGCNGDSDCPCGFRCGCYELAPNVNTCGICVR